MASCFPTSGEKALNQGSFCVNQQLQEKHLTRDELKEKLQNDDVMYTLKIRLYVCQFD